MAMEPFVSSPEEFVHGGESTLLWAFSPELPLDYASFPNLVPAVDMALGLHRSAFQRYLRLDGAKCWSSGTGIGGGRNIHRRIIQMLRRIPKGKEEEHGTVVTMSRGFRHMMRERRRREKLSQSYADLYSMLASRSKSDKNSIVQSAAQYVPELKGVKEALQKRNEELKAKAKIQLGRNSTEGAEIKIRVANPSSPIDSIIGALQCLQSMDAKAKAIRSHLSTSELSAIISIDTKMATADVERAVEGALMEVEKKLRCQSTGINAWSQQGHVENTI